MKFTRLQIVGAYLIELEPRLDERGFFARAWCDEEAAGAGIYTEFVQANFATTHAAGTIRGLHHQLDPAAEAKLVRCIRGRVFDVMVDVRPDSPTRGRWQGVELSAANRCSVFIPPGVAHGYQTLEDETELLYHVSAQYAPTLERGVRWDDPAFGIEWPIRPPTSVSPKDETWPLAASNEGHRE